MGDELVARDVFRILPPLGTLIYRRLLPHSPNQNIRRILLLIMLIVLVCMYTLKFANYTYMSYYEEQLHLAGKDGLFMVFYQMFQPKVDQS